MKKTANLSVNVLDDKIFSTPTILVGGIIFGVPAFIYFAYVNLRNMGYASLAKKVAIWTSLIFFLSLPAVLIIDQLFNISVPTTWFPPSGTAIVLALYVSLLKVPMEQHKAKAGRYYSLPRSAIVMAISTVIVLAYSVGYVWTVGRIYHFSFRETLAITAAGDNFDADLYDKQVNMIIKNEEAALRIFDSQDTASKEEWITGLENGMVLWDKNLAILHQIATMKSLPSFVKEDIAEQKKYTELRLEEYKLNIKAEQEQTDTYDAKINNITRELNQILDKIYKKG